MIKESEETEMKDIEWLKGKIEVFQKGENMFITGFNAGVLNALEYVQELIDELDEPDEVDRVLIKHIKDILPGFINDVKDGLAKLDKPEKVVVPDFVFNHIKKYKERGFSLWSATKYGEKYELETWMTGTNQKLYARAWDAYPNIEVEKEKKYYVKEPITGQFLIKDSQQSSGVKWVDGFSSNPESYTEQEIKAIDERFWPFAVPVEELEE